MDKNHPNYNTRMEEIIAELGQGAEPPALLLHSCCAPCSSAVLERLVPHFRVTVFYYNPNIDPPEEFRKRADEQRRFLALRYGPAGVRFVEGAYDPAEFEAVARGLEQEPEGGARCMRCYELRMRRTAELARREGFDFFTTTLSVSPYKNAAALNAIGARLAREIGVPFLFSDFKKKNGYLRSIRLSRQYGLYRQNFCGCRYSRAALHPDGADA